MKKYSKNQFSVIAVHIVLISFCMMLISCGATNTLLLESPSEKTSSKTIKIVEAKSTVEVSSEMKENFNKLLKKEIYSKGKFSEGNGITLEYRFLQFNEGSRMARWLTGGFNNAGEGTLTVEAVIKNGNNFIIAKIQVEGKIVYGFFGGSIDRAMTQVAQGVAKYTITNFQ